jgi:DNA-binding FadR family transcriptional regulator
MHRKDPIGVPKLGKSAVAEVELYRKIRLTLDEGKLEPGDRLPTERDLAEFYGTTRHLIRQAIQRLEGDGRLVRYVGKGTFVKPTVKDEQQAIVEDLASSTVSPLDILEARLVIEPGFADLLVARATQSDFHRLESLVVAIESAQVQRDFREAGYQFHLGLAQTTRNPLLIKIFKIVIEARAAAGWGRLKGLNDTQEARTVQAKSNRAILNAVIERDAGLTRKLIRNHFAAILSAVAFQEEKDE